MKIIYFKLINKKVKILVLLFFDIIKNYFRIIIIKSNLLF